MPRFSLAALLFIGGAPLGAALMPPLPCSPWHWAHANWTKTCAPSATSGETEADAAVVAVAAGAALGATLTTIAVQGVRAVRAVRRQ